MKHAKSLVARAALAAALSIAAASAHALPIVFDFSGTVTQAIVYENGLISTNSALLGQAVSGRITVETEGLQPFSMTNPHGEGVTTGLGDSSLDPAVLVTSELSIAGVNYDVAVYSGNSGSIQGFDSSGVPGCSGCSPAKDELTVEQMSTDYWGSPLPPAGEYYHRTLELDWSDATNPLGLLDLSGGFDPFDLLSLMTDLMPTGNFSDYTHLCADGVCGVVERQESMAFSVDSLTASAVGVPEPETLALFAIGLLGTGLARRTRRR